mgnify:FL=1
MKYMKFKLTDKMKVVIGLVIFIGIICFARYTNSIDSIPSNPNYNEDKLNELLDNTSRLLNDNNVTFWIDQGTLLGAIREGNFIKHDTDIDISIYKEEEDKLHKLLNNKGLLKKYGLTLIRIGGWCNSLKLINHTSNKDSLNEYDYIDIYVLNYIPLLETIYFKGIDYNVPKDPELYLSLVYGKDWNIPNPNGTANEKLWKDGFKGTYYSKYIHEEYP